MNKKERLKKFEKSAGKVIEALEDRQGGPPPSSTDPKIEKIHPIDSDGNWDYEPVIPILPVSDEPVRLKTYGNTIMNIKLFSDSNINVVYCSQCDCLICPICKKGHLTEYASRGTKRMSRNDINTRLRVECGCVYCNKHFIFDTEHEPRHP